MKIKNLYRVHGLLQTGASAYALSFIIPGAFEGNYLYAPVSVILGLITLEGVVDVIKGTYHYLGLNTFKYLLHGERRQTYESNLENIVNPAEREIDVYQTLLKFKPSFLRR